MSLSHFIWYKDGQMPPKLALGHKMFLYLPKVCIKNVIFMTRELQCYRDVNYNKHGNYFNRTTYTWHQIPSLPYLKDNILRNVIC